MLIEQTVLEAQEECKRFLAACRNKHQDVDEAFSAVLHAVRLVIAAVNMEITMDRRTHPMVVVYATAEDLRPGYVEHTSIDLCHDGGFVLERAVTCDGGCHTYSRTRDPITLEQMQEHGIDTSTVVLGICTFLQDPHGDLSGLADGYLN